MKASQQAFALIKRFEGCALVAYPDVAGVFTIGYGHTGDVMPYDQIHQADAEAFLARDVASVVRGINALVTVPLTQNQFDALVSFVFNVGLGLPHNSGPAAFAASTMLKLINKGDYAGAAEQFERWDHAGGKEVAGLKMRRISERDLFLCPDLSVA